MSKKKNPSNRSFGLVMAGFFCLLAFRSYIHGRSVSVLEFILAVVFFLSALCFPTSLRILNLAWTKFGELLQQLTSPIIMALIFFLFLTPMAFFQRLCGRDSLGLKCEKESYWIEKKKDSSMTQQF